MQFDWMEMMDLTMIGEIKKLPVKKVSRIVIAALAEKPGTAELLLVSDAEEDFVPLKYIMSDSVIRRPVNEMIDCAKCCYAGLPFSMVVISHTNMTAQEVYSVIMGKSIEVPSKKVLEKRDLQYLYWDENDEWKERMEKHWQKEFECDEPLWDGSEAVFNEACHEEERHNKAPRREPVIVKVRRKVRHSRSSMPTGND